MNDSEQLEIKSHELKIKIRRTVVIFFISCVLLFVGIYFCNLSVKEILNEYRLRNKGIEIIAYITEIQKNNIKYLFTLSQSGQSYSYSDVIGRKNLWASVKSIPKDAKTIKIVYLPSNPWVNRPKNEEGKYSDAIAGLTILGILPLTLFSWILYGLLPKLKPLTTLLIGTLGLLLVLGGITVTIGLVVKTVGFVVETVEKGKGEASDRNIILTPQIFEIKKGQDIIHIGNRSFFALKGVDYMFSAPKYKISDKFNPVLEYVGLEHKIPTETPSKPQFLLKLAHGKTIIYIMLIVAFVGGFFVTRSLLGAVVSAFILFVAISWLIILPTGVFHLGSSFEHASPGYIYFDNASESNVYVYVDSKLKLV